MTRSREELLGHGVGQLPVGFLELWPGHAGRLNRGRRACSSVPKHASQGFKVRRLGRGQDGRCEDNQHKGQELRGAGWRQLE